MLLLSESGFSGLRDYKTVEGTSSLRYPELDLAVEIA